MALCHLFYALPRWHYSCLGLLIIYSYWISYHHLSGQNLQLLFAEPTEHLPSGFKEILQNLSLELINTL